MNTKSREMMFSLISSAICGNVLQEEIKNDFSPETVSEIISVAKRHDVLQMISNGIEKTSLVPQGSSLHSELQKHTFSVVFRYEQLNFELGRLSTQLEDSGINFMPLKGSVIRKYYPEPWLRTSCDIDVLVKKDDIEKASAILCEKLGYERRSTGSHDVSFFSPGKIHVELHYTLIEDGLINDSARILENIWDTATLKEDSKHCYMMPDEMFYFYHIAHMAKHFENGGCGIRPFVDLCLLDKNFDLEKCDKLLCDGGLLKFADSARKLCAVWFDGKEYDSISSLMSEYVINGGVYGSESNRVSLQQQRRGGAVKYALSRIFLPYDVIKFYFPILQNHKWLLPFIQVCRWIGLVFRGRAGLSIKELKYNSEISSADAHEMRRFLDSIGL